MSRWLDLALQSEWAVFDSPTPYDKNDNTDKTSSDGDFGIDTPSDKTDKTPPRESDLPQLRIIWSTGAMVSVGIQD